MLRQTASLLFFLCYTANRGQQASVNLAEITDKCGEIEFLSALKNHYAGNISAMQSNRDTLAADANKLLLAAVKNRGRQQWRAYFLLHQKAAVKRMRQKLKLQQATEKVSPLLDEIAQRLGRLASQRIATAAVASTFETAAQTTNAKGTEGDFTDGQCVVTATRRLAAPKKCAVDQGIKGKLQAAATNAKDITVLKAAKLWTTSAAADAISIRLKNGATAAQPLTTKDGCSNDASAGSNGLKITDISKTFKQATTTKTALKHNGACITPGENDDEDTKQLKTLANKLCTANTADTTAQATVLETYTKVSDAVDDLADLALLMEGKRLEEIKPNEKEAAVTAILGSKETNIKTKLFEPLSKPDPILKFTKGDAPISIETAAGNSDTFAKALAVYEAESRKNLAAAASTGDNPKEAEKADSADKKEEKKEVDNKGATANCTIHATHDACSKGQNFKWENNA